MLSVGLFTALVRAFGEIYGFQLNRMRKYVA